MKSFKIESRFEPAGDQPQAITKLVQGLEEGKKHQVLLGVTGSGKTFTVAKVIEKADRPSLIIAPNKTLAAQLYNEFKQLFPNNAVEYFVSYYDYYQPEAYIPASDTYIQKDSSINEMIDKMRHSATRSVLQRRDVIVVASVSCIFGLGAPEDYLSMRVELEQNQEISRDRLLYKLVSMQYDRNDSDFHRGVFRVRGDRVEIFPAYEEDIAVRVEFFGDEIEAISMIDPLKGSTIKKVPHVVIFPASHYALQRKTIEKCIGAIIAELKDRIEYFRAEKMHLEEQRIEERTHFDLEMLQELGYCNGIENYSRHLTGRKEGDPPPTLLDYFPEDFLIFIDESHITVPQINGMYKGDRSRKETLVRYGFRLPSALDNRPLRFDEFTQKMGQTVYVSATPANYELENSANDIAEQIVRPTGLIDPVIDVRSAQNQVDSLFDEIKMRLDRNERVLVTTLTKRMAEDLTDYYSELGIKVRYLHSDIDTLERMEIIRELRLGQFDVLIGINLLREGLDIPEVSLVAIMDADKEGFLRSERSLIQTFGRAARNVNGQVIMYAENVTPSMHRAMEETNRRRQIQKEYNVKYNITPATIEKKIDSIFESIYEADYVTVEKVTEPVAEFKTDKDLFSTIKMLEEDMKKAAKELAFEKAAEIRDQIKALRELHLLEM